jgi:hypothetical protein
MDTSHNLASAFDHRARRRPGGVQDPLHRTPAGNVVWDMVGYVDEDAARRVRELGEVAAIVASHPHKYGMQVEWSRALGDAPVLVSEADQKWVARPDPAIHPWAGMLEVVPRVTLIQLGGHFPGSAVATGRPARAGRDDRTSSASVQPERRPDPERPTPRCRHIGAGKGSGPHDRRPESRFPLTCRRCGNDDRHLVVGGGDPASQRRLDRVEARNREAVLHLLMSRHISTTRQIAAVLSSPAARPRPSARRRRMRSPDAGLRGRVPQAVGTTECIHRPLPGPQATRHRHSSGCFGTPSCRPLAGCTIGTSDVVSLPETATGYEQAFDALAVARGLPGRRATFHPRLDPAVLFEPGAAAWAHDLMAPLLGYAPVRGCDPDAEELLATLRSWLSFSTAAKRHLKIHRNTLRARLQHIGALLDLDLDCLDHQAAVALALRIRRRPLPPQAVERSEPVPTPTLAELMRAPAMAQWARIILRPIRESPNAAILESTLRAWLSNNTRLSATAVALGISVPGTRKRIQRLERLLERSLLHAPDARHDLYLAIHAMDL